MRAEGERLLRPTIRHMEDQVTGQLAMKIGKVHFPEQHAIHTGYSAWRPGRTREWCYHNQISVLNFPLRNGVDRRQIAQAMQSFL